MVNNQLQAASSIKEAHLPMQLGTCNSHITLHTIIIHLNVSTKSHQ